MLGRQKFIIEEQFEDQYRESLGAAGLSQDLTEYLQDDTYAETMFAKLGYGKIETMDFASYEGPSIEHDLNNPVPKKLHNTFDFIFDGGTIEHVFNVPQALENMFHMLKPGGRFVSANGMNGWVGHGMWQFCPEMVWTFWKRKCQCMVHRCVGLHKMSGRSAPLDLPDAAGTGGRLRLRGKIPAGRLYLFYVAEKTDGALLKQSALQSDYETMWAGADA